MIIGIDIDNTIQDCEGYLDTVGVEYFGKPRVPVLSWRCFETDRFDVSKEEYERFWREKIDDYQLNGLCYKGVSEKIKELRSQGHKVIILTARATGWLGIEPDREIRNTEIWLDKNDIEYDDLVFAKEKGDAVKRLGIGTVIEDQPRQIRDILSKNPRVYLWIREQYYNTAFFYNELKGKHTLIDDFSRFGVPSDGDWVRLMV